MYHAVVRAQLRRAFRRIGAGDYASILRQFAPRHRHLMHGEHALGGERHTLESTARWYARLARLMPDLRFELGPIVVSGWPWRTVAMVAWQDRFSLPDGTLTSNQGVHVFELRWGKVHSLAVHCDTARLEGFFRRMVALGVAEAGAPTIEDAPLAADVAGRLESLHA
jgi:ketosteroid isomerase-like protein